MGNAADQIIQPTPIAPVWTDPGARTLRQLQTFAFTQTVTSTVTVATANAIPQITQGNEVLNFNFTAQSLSSWIEIEVFTNIMVTNTCNYWIALFADYSPDALLVNPGVQSGAASNLWPIYFKHYLQPVTLGPVRYSIRMAPSANAMILNWYAYGNRTQSRVTIKEWSGQTIQNI